MQVLAFVNQKGGAGKTTLAASCGAYAAERGSRVCLVEMDDQGSLAAWFAERQKLGIAEPKVVSIDSASKLQSTLAVFAPEFDIVILDTKGEDSALTVAAVNAADFCVVPTRPLGLDLKACLPTLHCILGARKPFGFVLNQAPARSKRVEDTQAALATLGVGASTVMVSRIDHADAVSLGYGITEYRSDSAASAEMRSLWTWIEGQLAFRMEKAHANAA